MKTLTSVLCCLSFGIGSFSSIALAARGHSQLNVDELKAKCLELSGNQQIKPFKVVVTCRDTALIWRQSQQKPSSFSLQNSREIGASLRMKSFETPFASQAVEIQQTSANCIHMDQFQRITPAVDKEVSCDELNQIPDLTQYCLAAIETRIQEDPSIVVEEPTGQTYNSCLSGQAAKVSGINGQKPGDTSEQPTDEGEQPTEE